jgi:branched-chain amino acid transport system permease protein
MNVTARGFGLVETPVILVVLVATVVLVALNGSFTVQSAAAGALISMLMVTALNIFIGTSGVFSFGHVAFMAMGAYSTGILASSEAAKSLQLPALPAWLASIELNQAAAVLVSALAVGVFGLMAGTLLLRLSGLAAGSATLSLLIITRGVLQNWDKYTNGTRGLIVDVNSPSMPQLGLWAIGGILIALVFRGSAVGMRLAASREDETAARAAGINVYRERVIAFTLSAFVAALSGGLYALYFQSFNPNNFFLTATLTTIAMLVVGGSGSVSGAILGTIFLATVLELLRDFEDAVGRPGISDLGLSLALLVTLLFRPSGMTGGNELRVSRAASAVLARWGAGSSPGGPGAVTGPVADREAQPADVSVSSTPPSKDSV